VQKAIFIGYRRDDTGDAAGRLYDLLAREFGARRVFKDVDDIPYGADFGQHITKTLSKCRIFLALIGPSWINVRDENGRRLDNPDDWVRLELERALTTAGLQVVPVLVNEARMPRSTDLPDCLQSITTRHAAVVRRDPDFHGDARRLALALKKNMKSPRRVWWSPTGFNASAAPKLPPQPRYPLAQLPESDRAVLRRVMRNLYPGAPVRSNLSKLNYEVEIDAHGNAKVTQHYEVVASQSPVHFWQFYLEGDEYAAPVSSLTDIRLAARSLTPDTAMETILTEASAHRKELAAFFLPEIAPGATRSFELKYEWKGWFGELVKKGETHWSWSYKSADPTSTANVRFQFAFSAEVGKVLCTNALPSRAGDELYPIVTPAGIRWIYENAAISCGALTWDLRFRRA
jgi:hypothetical protein